ncbi:MAG: phosphoribosylformylglycinamidine synthase I [Candidatus Omnitrophica bacterium CG07_land_8_20_14_0_80_42_15]|uniref:Phosphoribosylformylglycinamidine synthase subunit PurQ n=1 Tax=Candidatus Aquitaenariimonas noxiae TaxID=1974741 RepID=A0A2J0KYL7_9BACT|nr:MAG: phosphoribosylformylglycinamidine synthase I [Candidatus Omnitrophica bacterium CG07_land_8_20_14_0_80_42_15]
MKFGVIVFPGSNCEQDCFYAIRDILKQPAEYIWHKNTKVDAYDCLVLPGGFSYGDYLRTGAVARFSPVMKSVTRFAHRGGLVIGICNGFQILLEAGLLPGAMLRNKNLHFICKHVHIKLENNATPFTNLGKRDQILKIPIAHNEGNYYIDTKGLKNLTENKQIVFRYCSEQGEVGDRFNPNGAIGNVAGIINKQGNVLGMMPHPERSAEKLLGSDHGSLIFKSTLKWLKGK